jgi:RND family efflux transporter MFP subunit
MRLSLLLFAAALTGLSLTGCGSAAGDLPPPEPPKVVVAPPLEREVRDDDEYTGRIEAQETVEVRARVSGYLKDIYFQDGDFVEKGQPLFLIDPRTYQAEYDQAEARIKLYDAKYGYAKAVRVRSEKLVENKSVSREEYEQNVAAENEALAARRSAEADTETNRLNLEFTRVVAEIAGRIDRAFVTRGNLVQSGPGATLLTRIVSVDPVYCYFNPDELAFLRYTRRRVEDGSFAAAQPVREREIEATIVLADGSVYPTKGKVDFASNTVDPSTGTIQVRAVFPNSQRALTPGLFVRLRIASEQSYAALLVPDRSINTDQSDKFVYVVNAKQIAERRNVTLGTKHGRLRVVKTGLAAGDKVIINGGLLVRPGQTVQPAAGTIEDLAEAVVTTQYKPSLSLPASNATTNSGPPPAQPPALPSAPPTRAPQSIER